MIDKYMQLKKKGLTPSVALVDLPPGGFPPAGETKEIRLTMTLYDLDTGQVDRQMILRQGLSAFIAEGKEARKRWLAYKEVYEALAGEGFPND